MTSTAVTTFAFHASSIRVVELEGNPWFVASDVLRTLGFSRVDNMLRIVGADERGVTPHPVRGVDGRSRVHSTISESGLYKLVMRSDKPEARQFQDWVTRVVLPAIRKDGGYIAGEEKVATGEMDEDELVLKAMEVPGPGWRW